MRYTASKDSAFKFENGSPIKAEERDSFEGLKYFPYNAGLVFRVKLEKYETPDSVKILGSKENDIRPGLKYGYFDFEYQNQTYRLQVLKSFARSNPAISYLFLGFTDASTGQTTYGAGRYVDIEESADGMIIVDFNRAYNPYCAYNERFSCAIPPAENHLTFAVEAGEKIYREH
jgi:uncharacterized protein (DUF1684 family)